MVWDPCDNIPILTLAIPSELDVAFKFAFPILNVITAFLIGLLKPSTTFTE